MRFEARSKFCIKDPSIARLEWIPCHKHPSALILLFFASFSLSLSLSLCLSLSLFFFVMIFSKTLSVAVLALVAIASVLVDASPIPAPQVEAYIPVAERVYTAEQLNQHAALRKRGLPGVNDWSCKPSQAHPKALILVHGLVRFSSVFFSAIPMVLPFP